MTTDISKSINNDDDIVKIGNEELLFNPIIIIIQRLHWMISNLF